MTIKRAASMAILAIALTGCTSARVNTPASAPASTTTPVTKPVAHTGATLSLTGEDVTLTRIIDPAAVDASGIGAGVGKRMVAAVLRIRNTSSVGFVPEAITDATLIDQGGLSYTPSVWPTGSCQGFAPDIVVEAGTSVAGCVVFDVNDGGTPVRFQYQPRNDARFGEWLIP